MKPKKEYGQNFLRDLETVERLVAASQPKKTDNYLEIGPGEGVVTQILAGQVNKVVAVELDPDLIPNLNELSDSINNIKIVGGDALRFICSNVLIHQYKINKVVGSIPYQITSPLLYCLAKIGSDLQLVTLLVQKEVAEKISATPPDASFLSNFVQTYFNVEYVETVPREYFYPVPKVDGAIIKMESRIMNQESRIEPEEWSAFLHRAFEHPRKMLRRFFDEKILKEAGIVPTQRPQEISIGEWFKLYELINTGSREQFK